MFTKFALSRQNSFKHHTITYFTVCLQKVMDLFDPQANSMFKVVTVVLYCLSVVA